MSDLLQVLVLSIIALFISGALLMWLAPMVWAGYTLGWGQSTLLILVVRLILPTPSSRAAING